MNPLIRILSIGTGKCPQQDWQFRICPEFGEGKTVIKSFDKSCKPIPLNSIINIINFSRSRTRHIGQSLLWTTRCSDLVIYMAFFGCVCAPAWHDYSAVLGSKGSPSSTLPQARQVRNPGAPAPRWVAFINRVNSCYFFSTPEFKVW